MPSCLPLVVYNDGTNASLDTKLTWNLNLGRLFGPAADRDEPIYRWFPFRHSFSRHLVQDLLAEWQIGSGATILDPFCGGGTTLLASGQKGINSIGYDILPFSVLLSRVKTRRYDTTALRRVLDQLRLDVDVDVSFLDEKPAFLRKAFPPDVLCRVLGMRESICQITNGSIRDFFLVALLSCLESLSFTTKTGGFLRFVAKDLSFVDPTQMVRSAALAMIEDLELASCTMPEGVRADVRLGDARLHSRGKVCEALITSPPYPNRHDYTRIYLLELLIGSSMSESEIKSLRYRTLRSHVEARQQIRAVGYQRPAALERILDCMAQGNLNNSGLLRMIAGYFEDMHLCLVASARRLRSGGRIAFVVSNARFGGHCIPVDTILAEIGQGLGLKVLDIRVGRVRGNSPQQMGRFGRAESRESIIIWEKDSQSRLGRMQSGWTASGTCAYSSCKGGLQEQVTWKI